MQAEEILQSFEIQMLPDNNEFCGEKEAVGGFVIIGKSRAVGRERE